MQPFVPESIPPAALDWQTLIPRLGRANRALATYAGILEAIPNQGLLLAPLSRRVGPPRGRAGRTAVLPRGGGREVGTAACGLAPPALTDKTARAAE